MKIDVALGDVLSFTADLLILKHADDYYGVDETVASAIGLDERIAKGEFLLVRTSNLSIPNTVFFGVGPLAEFRYEQIRQFSKRALTELARNPTLQAVRARHVAVTAHGIGYGLDEREAFGALVAGLQDATEALPLLLLPERVTIIERSERRFTVLSRLLPILTSKEPSGRAGALDEFIGARSEEKPKLFAAMPFEERYLDEYEIAFCEAANTNGYLCERLDLATFVGDVLSEIKKRIAASSGVIALMNDANANVFLEIGFAWAKEKPTLLVLKRGQTAPFDVRGHRYIDYASIAELRTRLTSEIGELKKQGVFR